jgi:RNA polymerase sigma-70 factor (ECF subfamily)
MTGTLQTGSAYTSADFAAPPDDLGVVRALRAGDEAAFVALLERHNAGMTRLARLLTGDPVAADELIRETWLTILDGLDHYEPGTPLRVQIFGALLAHVADYRQRRHGAGRAVTRHGIERTHALLIDSPSDERWPSVYAALMSLPVLQLAVLGLRDIEGWRLDEVCVALGLSGLQACRLLQQGRTVVGQALGASLAAGRTSATYASAC